MRMGAGTQIVCPYCGSLNRVPAERPALVAVRPYVE